MTKSILPATRRSIVYVDGFNLYYGALKGSRHKWLNLQQYFLRLRPNDDVHIVEGRFKPRSFRCAVRGCSYKGNRTFTRLEEKRTDVSIAVQMLSDAHANRCDAQILVSGDSDLVPAVTSIKRTFPQMQALVYVPNRHTRRGHAVELRGVADRSWDLPLQIMPHAQFPATVPGGYGETIIKPADW